MERIKKHLFSVPEDSDPDAADLIKKLLVGSCFPSILKMPLNSPQVTDPAERLGLAPHSSPSELRAHPLFADVDWESLWTSPVPEIAAGYIKKSKDDEKTEEEKEELWAKFGEIEIVDSDN